MKLPPLVWHLKGSSDGPTAVVFGGTHGDELTGIEILRRLLKMTGLTGKPSGTYAHDALRGDLYLAFGNPEAIVRGTRGASAEIDLNRSFAPSHLSRAPAQDDAPDIVRARELAPLLAAADFFLDIHATSSPSPAFLCMVDDDAKRRALAALFPVERVMIDRDAVISQDQGHGEPCTTDAYVHAHGGIGIVYETGYEKDLTVLEIAFGATLRFLRAIGSVSGALGDVAGKGNGAQEYYALASAHFASADGFAYEPGMDKGWQRVTKGQSLGSYGDGTPETIAGDGTMLFPRGISKVRKAKNLYYLAKPL